MSKCFSVIVPVYNKALYVEKALRSVLSQTLSDYELIVVDDGSVDGSDKICERCLSSLSHCHFIRQKNQGVSMARNNGVVASHGDYICFLDADDWWEPAFLENMAQLIQEYPDAGIYGTGYTIINEHKHKTRIAPIGVESDFVKGYINYCQVYAKTLCMPLTSISTCIPRLVFNELGGFKSNLKLGEDFDLWIRIALKYKVAFLNTSLGNYNQDVDVNQRATRHLHNPHHHMLWNLSYLEPIEQSNSDYKQLIDKLRVNGLFPYFISKEYHDDAVKELQKVDWSKQPLSCCKRYKQPLWYLRLRQWIRKGGSILKQNVISCLYVFHQ